MDLLSTNVRAIVSSFRALAISMLEKYVYGAQAIVPETQALGLCNFTVGDDTLSVNKFFERMVILSVLALFWSVLLPFATPRWLCTDV